MRLSFPPPPGGGIAFLAGCFIVASLYFTITGGDSWYTQYVCPFFFPLGIGLWLKQSWARWLTFAFFVMLLPLVINLMFQRGVSVRHVVKALLIAATAYSLWEWDVDGTSSDGEPLME